MFIGSLSGLFVALDAQSGEQLWCFEAEEEITSSAAALNGKVIFGSKNGTLYCLDQRDGKVLWKYDTKGKIINSPAVVNGVVYFGSTT